MKHRGCNVANWNQIECKRTINSDTQEITINNTFPIVFIHFTNSTFKGIIQGEDALLKPYMQKYNALLVKNGFQDVVAKIETTISNTSRTKEAKISEQRQVDASLKDGFIHIERTVQNMDRYLIRTSIKEAVRIACKKFSNNLLDIGCGTGDFLETAKQNNWQVSGIEPNNQARERFYVRQLQNAKVIYIKCNGIHLRCAWNFRCSLE